MGGGGIWGRGSLIPKPRTRAMDREGTEVLAAVIQCTVVQQGVYRNRPGWAPPFAAEFLHGTQDFPSAPSHTTAFSLSLSSWPRARYLYSVALQLLVASLSLSRIVHQEATLVPSNDGLRAPSPSQADDGDSSTAPFTGTPWPLCSAMSFPDHGKAPGRLYLVRLSHCTYQEGVRCFHVQTDSGWSVGVWQKIEKRLSLDSF